MTEEHLARPAEGDSIRLVENGAAVGYVTVRGYNSGPPHGPWVVAVTEGHTDARLRLLLRDEDGWYVTVEP